MKSILFSSIILTLSMLMACSPSEKISSEKRSRKALQTLAGTYCDNSPYAYGNAFGQRTFTFDKGSWTLDFTLGLDPKLDNKVFSFRTYGTYQVLKKSSSVENAYEALFLEEKKFLTLYTENPQLIQAFGLEACQLAHNKEKDISAEGCSLWASVKDCKEDHDLISLDADGGLHFGVRPADNNMCTADRRPTQLTPPVYRVN